jgi:antitoxin Phd
MAAWQLQEAKNKLSELIERALAEGPQVITRHGEEVVIVIPAMKYRKMMAPKQKLGDFLLASPLRNSKLEISRDRTMATREIDL